MSAILEKVVAALRLVAVEVTDGIRPTSADSYLPSDIVRELHEYDARALLDAPEQEAVGSWQGAEDWERLAYELCLADGADEDEARQLIWEGFPPEPWGERWQKYEGEAIRMIEMVRKYTAPPPAQKAGPVPVIQSTAPKRIYLQISDEPGDEDTPFTNCDDAEITWCASSVVEIEVPYVRADLAHPPAPEELRPFDWNELVIENTRLRAENEELRSAWKEAIVKACMQVESCLDDDPEITIDNLRKYWFSEGERHQDCVVETDLVLSLRDEVAKLRGWKDRIELLGEVNLISDTYDHIRATRPFAVDDLEYDLFAAGWKAAIDAMKESK